MGEFRLPAETHIGFIRLQVTDLTRAMAFYGRLLSFQLVHQEATTAVLSATGRAPYHILLTERLGAQPKPPHTTGLYHVAIRFPTRQTLAQVFQRLVAHRWPFQGFADHLVSEALYLADPDGNGLELYVDRPREQWRLQNGQINMGTDALDVDDLLAEAAGNPELWTGVHPDTDIGHVHLHVSDLARAEAFYSELLGLDVTQRSYPGALFLSAGGYHHHLGINTWAGAGAPPPPSDAVGLLSFALHLPDEEVWSAVQERVQRSGVVVEAPGDYEYARRALVRDPDGNGMELLVNKKKT